MKLTLQQIKASGFDAAKTLEISEAYAFEDMREAREMLTAILTVSGGSAYGRIYYSGDCWVVEVRKPKPGELQFTNPVFYAKQKNHETLVASGDYGTVRQ